MRSLEDVIHDIQQHEYTYLTLENGAKVAAGGLTLVALRKLIKDGRKEATRLLGIQERKAVSFEQSCEIQRQSFRYKYPNNSRAYPWLDFLSRRTMYIDQYIPNERLQFTIPYHLTELARQAIQDPENPGIKGKLEPPAKSWLTAMVAGPDDTETWTVDSTEGDDPAEYLYISLGGDSISLFTSIYDFFTGKL